MEPEDEKKEKINDDMVVFMRKRSETEAPRYTAKLKTYVNFQQKRRRATDARRHSGGYHDRKPNSASRKKNDGDVKDKGAENRRRGGDKCVHRTHRIHSFSRSRTGEPEDQCCTSQRRKKSVHRRRRRRSCRRQRRRRSGRRKSRRRSCRRKRRRSSSRRRRMRSCRRRRRRAGCLRKPRRRC